MHEVITISLSQRSNHLTTQFHNSQESYLAYSKDKKSGINSNVHLKSSISSDGRTVNYEPRAMLFDLGGGFGALGKYEYHQPTDSISDYNDYPNVEIIKTKVNVVKNEYQKALDSGAAVTGLLTVDNTKYWSDYSRLIYNPKSFQVLHNWVYDPVTAPKGKLLKSDQGSKQSFDDYSIGVNEWQLDRSGDEIMDDSFRSMLESSDLLNGINVVTDIDSAWGGYSNELLTSIRDEYSNKVSILSWGFSDNKYNTQLSNKEQLSRMKSFLGLVDESSLVIPLSNPKIPMNWTDQGIDLSSYWHSTSLQNLAFESVNCLFSQNENSATIYEFASNLALNDNRNIVDQISCQLGDGTKLNFSGYNLRSTDPKKKAKSPNTFSKSMLVRDDTTATSEDELLKKYGLSELNSRTTKIYTVCQPYRTNDSSPDLFPASVTSDFKVVTDLAVTDSQKQVYKDYKTFISKFLRGDDRDVYTEKIENLISNYSVGWDSDYESDDDY